MKRILLTGMSGTGKSTLVRELAARGFKAIDADSDAYSEWVEVQSEPDDAGSTVEPGRDWVWREGRIQQLLDTDDAPLLFLSGCAANMGQFLSRFDHIVLLGAPANIILQRLAERTTNSYGKQPDEAARVLNLIETIEPRLRRIATAEIDTSAPLDDVLARLLRLVAAP
jgi:dephospho-CoA kinase